MKRSRPAKPKDKTKPRTVTLPLTETEIRRKPITLTLTEAEIEMLAKVLGVCYWAVIDATPKVRERMQQLMLKLYLALFNIK